MVSRKLNFPATDRNREPILEVLQKVVNEKLPRQSQYRVLEIAGGSGQHGVYFAQELPQLIWQPTDLEEENLASIEAYVKESCLKNILMPVAVDISKELTEWPTEVSSHKYDLIVCINMIHISPWKCTESLFKNGASLLKPNGVIFTYGPYAHQGMISPESNVSFNRSLKSRNPEWGLRDTDDVKKVATNYGFTLDSMFAMPSNNHSLIFMRNKL